MSDKYISDMLAMRQKLLHHVKQSATDVLETSSKRVIQKTAETTGDLIANNIKKFPKNSQQNNSDTVTNENNKEIPKERYLSPEERHKIIDNLGFNIIV